jgi:hypothetical protein
MAGGNCTIDDNGLFVFLGLLDVALGIPGIGEKKKVVPDAGKLFPELKLHVWTLGYMYMF